MLRQRAGARGHACSGVLGRLVMIDSPRPVRRRLNRCLAACGGALRRNNTALASYGVAVATQETRRTILSARLPSGEVDGDLTPRGIAQPARRRTALPRLRRSRDRESAFLAAGAHQNQCSDAAPITIGCCEETCPSRVLCAARACVGLGIGTVPRLRSRTHAASRRHARLVRETRGDSRARSAFRRTR